MAAGTDAPRNFKLLDEYDAAIGKLGASLITGKHANCITYGIDESIDDPLLHHWRAMIIGPQDTNLGQFMYNLKITATDSYPKDAPIISFLSPKISMPAVDAKGNVDLKKLDPAFAWVPSMNIADALMAIRENMYKPAVIKASQGLGDSSSY